MFELLRAGEPLLVDEQSEAAIRIAAGLRVYGCEQPFFRVYRGAGGSLLSVLDHAATLVAGEDADEALLFLRMSPEITSLRTDADTARRFAALCGGTAQTGVVMRAPTGTLPSACEPLPTEMAAREAYPLLSAVFGTALLPFDVWYADVSHRVRRDACRLYGVRVGDTVASVAMSVAEGASAWLLGAVATHPDFRRRGYAATCVTALAAVGQARGKEVYISPKNEGARRLYAALGFAECGTWGAVTL